MQIPIETILTYKNTVYAEPIKDLLLPNVVVPKHLKGEKYNDVCLEVRAVFNALTKLNIVDQTAKLVNIVNQKAVDKESLRKIAKEIFESFMVSEANIPNCMPLLNAVCNKCSMNDDLFQSIGDIFVDLCRVTIIDIVSWSSVEKLATLDRDDLDELDTYNKERDKTCCIISILCHLYDQRNQSKVKLSAEQLIPTMMLIMTNYNRCVKEMKELGDPLKSECTDEDTYFLRDDMRHLYIEQMYSLLCNRAHVYLADKTKYKSAQKEELQFKDVINVFRRNVIPSIAQDHLKERCKEIKFD